MNDQLIQSRLSQLSPSYREFIESEYITEVARTFGQAHSFTEKQTDVLENAITLYLLLFIDSIGTVEFIHRNCDLPPETASALFIAIKTALPNDIVEAAEATIHLLNTGETTLLANEIAEAELQSDIVETEQVFEQLQGIRTMARDMQAIQHPEEPTYRSTQSDILDRNNGPRWDTEQ